MAIDSKPQPLVQLFAALQAEGIEFLVAGMSAANLQGVLISTLDVDVWIGLPARQYMRVINLCHKLRATIQSPNKVYLSDDTPVDFIYKIEGLPPFEKEYPRAKWLPFHGLKIPVLPLERICKSKRAIGRDKDKLHVLLIRQAIRLQNVIKRARRKPAGNRARRARLKRQKPSRPE
jgi:hypothetical protein